MWVILTFDKPYHTKHGNGPKSPRPKDGQKALDNSISFKSTSSARVGVSCSEIVILRKTALGMFHGYVCTWDDLDQKMQNGLKKANLVNAQGKIIHI